MLQYLLASHGVIKTKNVRSFALDITLSDQIELFFHRDEKRYDHSIQKQRKGYL